MHIGSPSTIKKHPELYVNSFEDGLRPTGCSRIIRLNTLRYTPRLLMKLVISAKQSYMKYVVKKLRAEVFLLDVAKFYPNEMARK